MTGSGRCSDLSRAADEPLAGTASTAEHWLLVEVPGPWGRDVGTPGVLPPRAHDALSAWLERTPRSRVHFVRRPGRSNSRPLAFVVRAEEMASDVRRIELEAHDDLANVDFEADGEPDRCAARPRLRARKPRRLLRSPRHSGVRGARRSVPRCRALVVVPSGRPSLRGERARPPGGNPAGTSRCGGRSRSHHPCARGRDRARSVPGANLLRPATSRQRSTRSGGPLDWLMSQIFDSRPSRAWSFGSAIEAATSTRQPSRRPQARYSRPAAGPNPRRSGCCQRACSDRAGDATRGAGTRGR